MALTPWKSLPFFEVCTEASDETDWGLGEAVDYRCMCTGNGMIYFGMGDGHVVIVTGEFKAYGEFEAYETGCVAHIKQIGKEGYLATIGEDLYSEPVVKIWDTSKVMGNKGNARCLSSISIHNGKRLFPVSAFAVTEDLSQIAVGFANGSISVVRGDLIHDRGTRQRSVFESEEPVTGIEFVNGQFTTLCITTTGRVTRLLITGRGVGQVLRDLDEVGCDIGCMAVDDDGRDIIVGRYDGISYYTTRGKSGSYGYECEKKSVTVFNDYVVILSKECEKGTGLTGKWNVIILNTDLKFVGYRGTVMGEVKDVFIMNDKVYVMTQDNRVIGYREKGMEEKLRVLYSRNLYVLAINLTQRVSMSIEMRNEVFRKYGDYLYEKQDYDTAMQQYLRAITTTEASYVIGKFLDTQQIHNLIGFLEELHERGLGTSDHTMLLLNCYAKTKNVDKLEEFIKGREEGDFEVDVVIGMCRLSGFFEQAVYLGKKYGENELVVEILIEDCKRFKEAIMYMRSMGAEAVCKSMERFAGVFMEKCPEETCDLLVEVYSGKYCAQGREYCDYEVSYPGRIFTAFMEYTMEFIRFVEACLGWSKLRESQYRGELVTMLFGLYVKRWNEVKEEVWINKAKELVTKEEKVVDWPKVALLSELENFDEGNFLIQEREGLYIDIFRSYTMINDTKGIMKCVRKYGDIEKEIYVGAIKYILGSEKVMQEVGKEEVEYILNKIREERILTAIQVITILGTSKMGKIGMIKEYLREEIERIKGEIEEEEVKIKRLEELGDEQKKEMKEMKDNGSVWINNVRCSGCQKSLEFPAVHFYCKHSFHMSCTDGEKGEYKCRICKKENLPKLVDEDSVGIDNRLQAGAKGKSGDKFLQLTRLIERGILSEEV